MRKYGILYVVETERNRFFGVIESKGNKITVYSGYQGRPPVISIDEIVSMTPAHAHPDVEKK